MADLGKYRRKTINGVTLKMGGLSTQLTDALALDPMIYEPGGWQVVACWANMRDHTFQDDTGELHQLLIPQTAAIIECALPGDLGTQLREHLAKLAVQIQQAKDDAPGQKAMDVGTGKPDHTGTSSRPNLSAVPV